MNNKKRKMEVMAMPNTRAYVMRTPNRDKAIKLEAYKEFAELAREKIFDSKDLDKADACWILEEALEELEAKLNENN